MNFIIILNLNNQLTQTNGWWFKKIYLNSLYRLKNFSTIFHKHFLFLLHGASEFWKLLWDLLSFYQMSVWTTWDQAKTLSSSFSTEHFMYLPFIPKKVSKNTLKYKNIIYLSQIRNCSKRFLISHIAIFGLKYLQVLAHFWPGAARCGLRECKSHLHVNLKIY